MRCVFQTNPCKSPQDDYVWYRLADDHWEVEPNSGNTPQFSDAVVIPRAFSTIRGGSSFLVLLRDKGMLSLCVDAPTLREEVGQHRRPIKDTLYLQAENPADETVLCGFAERCLSVDDEEGLGKPRSEVGAAVDEIWATASLQNFKAKFGGVQVRQGGESVNCESWVYPRQDLVARRMFAQKVRSAVACPRPFLVALTDRTPSEALSELRSFSGQSVVFSARIASAQKVARAPFPFNRTGAMIAAGAAIVLSVWAIVPSRTNGPTTSAVESEDHHLYTNSLLDVEESCGTNSADFSSDLVLTNRLNAIK